MRYLLIFAAALVGFGLLYWAVSYQNLRQGEIAAGNPTVLQETAINGDVQTQLRAAGHLIATQNNYDRTAGVKMLEDLAAKGEPHALQQLGMIYLNGLSPIPPDPRRALGSLIRAAQAGNEPARGTLIVIYSSGKYGIPADPAKAEKWRQRAKGNR